MLKDAIVDHRLPVQSMLAAQLDGSMPPRLIWIEQGVQRRWDTRPPHLLST